MPALRSLRQEDLEVWVSLASLELKAWLSFMERSYLRKIAKENRAEEMAQWVKHFTQRE